MLVLSCGFVVWMAIKPASVESPTSAPVQEPAPAETVPEPTTEPTEPSPESTEPTESIPESNSEPSNEDLEFTEPVPEDGG